MTMDHPNTNVHDDIRYKHPTIPQSTLVYVYIVWVEANLGLITIYLPDLIYDLPALH